MYEQHRLDLVGYLKKEKEDTELEGAKVGEVLGGSGGGVIVKRLAILVITGVWMGMEKDTGGELSE